MSIPDYRTFMLPVLQAADAGEVRIADLSQQMADKFGLTGDERTALLPSGHQTILANRIGWAKTYLAKAGLVESKRRGYFSATNRGRDVLANPPKRIDVAFLSLYPEFQQFKRSGREGQSNGNDVAITVTESSSTPADD